MSLREMMFKSLNPETLNPKQIRKNKRYSLN